MLTPKRHSLSRAALGIGAMLSLLVGVSGAGGPLLALPAQASVVSLHSVVPSENTGCDGHSGILKPVPLHLAKTYAVLAGNQVTNAGATLVMGDLGVSPGTIVTGFPPGVLRGTMHAGDPAAAIAEQDVARAYDNAARRPNAVLLPADIGGMAIAPGVYAAPVSLGISSNVMLDGKNNTSSVFIFQIPSTLTVATNAKVVLINGANACNVFWQVGSSATLGTSSVFAGTILAFASISVGTGAQVNGRLLAESGTVSLLTNFVREKGL